MTRIALACALLASALPGQQIFRSMSMSSDQDGIHAVFSAVRVTPGAVVTGAPYSADQVSEHTQTLADGTHIAQPNNGKQHMARDSQGRVRIERPIMGGGPDGQMPLLVEISDPVAGVAYILDDQNKVAHRVTMEARARTAPPRAGGVGVGIGGGGATAVGTTGITATTSVVHPNQPDRSTEHLGTQTIEGVIADGTRTTLTWPVGSRGNDRPFTDTNEMWNSKELKLLVLSKNSSPLSGDFVTKVINISRAEPDASLFQPPPDYTVVDDKDTVTLNLKRQ